MSAFEFTTFTASEAEQISRVSSDQQRNFRRAGYIRAGDGGWTRYSLEDLAELVVIGFQLERKMPPRIASEIARQCAPMIVAHALKNDGAIEGGDKTLRDELRIKFAPKGLKRFAVVTPPERVDFGNDGRKILAAMQELGMALVLDLKFYGALIFDGAKRPLVNVTTKRKDDEVA